jgi:hypothetical protein
VLFLVPKADTRAFVSSAHLSGWLMGDPAGCTNQACAFRDSYPDFSAHNYNVYCLSADTPAALTKWQTKVRSFVSSTTSSLILVRRKSSRTPSSRTASACSLVHSAQQTARRRSGATSSLHRAASSSTRKSPSSPQTGSSHPFPASFAHNTHPQCSTKLALEFVKAQSA